MNTTRLIEVLATVSGTLAGQVGLAHAPAGAPPGAMGVRRDRTYYAGANKQGACRGHKDVQQGTAIVAER
jgi:hypothetical protein